MIEIELNKIKKNYGLKNILNGVSFQAKTGERIALIGQNGCGKTTLLKIIKGDELADSGTISIKKDATIDMLNQIYKTEENNPTVYEFLQSSFKKCMILEEKLKKLEESLSKKSEEKEIEKLLKQYGKIQEEYISIGGYEIKEKIDKICSGFNFNNNILKQKYNNLSGGEKTVVNLASILLKNPSILLLDEPTNHLDIQTLDWLEKFLINYKGTILMVSHDRFFLDKVATKTILIEEGKEKIYLGNYSYFIKEDERRTLAEFEVYKNQQKQIEKMKESIKKLRKFGEIAKNEMFFKRAKSIEKRLEKMQVVDKVNLQKEKIKLNLQVKERSGKDVLIIKNLYKKYDDKEIFNNLNLQITYGEKICLLGNNGTGKSTLIKIILQKDNEYIGKIQIGTSVKIGYIPQEIIFENENATILDYFIKDYIGTETNARTTLAKYGFRGENVFKKLKSLSGGEKVRLILVKLMQKDINFLILDEPTNHIDISTREVLEEIIKDYKGTVLFVSHDRYFIKNIANRIIKIEDKQLKSYTEGLFVSN